MPSALPTEPLSVLVVDDDSALIRTLSDILRLHGYAPTTAVTAQEGLAIAARQAPVLAVIDLRLPDMDGTELASKLHSLSEMTQVVVLTGNASVESAIAALREQSVDYLVKPVNVERLLQVASLAAERWQRRQAEERLRASDERFRRVVQSDLLGIKFWDERGIYDANDAFLSMIGYTREDLEGGLDLGLLTPPDMIELVERKRQELDELGIIPPYEREYLTKSGLRVPALVGAATLAGPGGSGVAFVLDITDRKSAERALEARARQQAAVAKFGQRALVADDLGALFEDAVTLVSQTLDAPIAGVFERRSDGVSLFFRAGVGWPTKVGQTVAMMKGDPFPRSTPAQGHAPISEREAGERLLETPFLRGTDDISGLTVVIPGSIAPFGVLAVHDRRLRDFSQDDVHFMQAIGNVLGTAVDRNRTDAAFRQTQRLEAVGRLASGISHDFNNMLTAITAFAEMIRADLPAGAPMRGDVDEILHAAGRAAALTRQLLAFSRQQVLQPRLVSLNDVIVQMEKMLQPLLGPEIKVRRALATELGLVKADPGKIEQVILNLCVNARDAMPDGGTLTISTMNAELDGVPHHHGASIEAPGRYVMLSVSDTGIGMDAETQSRVFEPFFSTKSPEKGTGLGLATVYGIVKQSGGEIWLYSEVGFGTTFKVYLPRVDGIDAEQSSRPRARASAGAETILLAEDDEANRRVAQRILEQAGYRVLTAKNGADALEVAADHDGPIHLLITDVLMPVVNGPQLAQALRVKQPNVPVLYLSGYSD
ncbi:MAG TPA: response regulator, partial [Gemmatimonadaceae bacterium]